MMIEYELEVTTHGDGWVSVRIRLIDRTDGGIQSYNIEDQAGVTIASDHAVPCEPSRIVELGRIETTRLPLFVRAMDCHGEPFRLGPILPPYIPSPGYDGPVAPCSSVVHIPNRPCEEAQADVLRRREAIAPLCEQMDQLRNEALRMRQLFGIFLTAGLITLGMGVACLGIPVIGWIVGGALIAAALLLLAWAAVYLSTAMRYEAEMRELRAEVDGMLPNFDAAVARAQALCRCPGELVVDTSRPC